MAIHSMTVSSARQTVGVGYPPSSMYSESLWHQESITASVNDHASQRPSGLSSEPPSCTAK
jgi:hypothetical protein